jgi:hypothetical protein
LEIVVLDKQSDKLIRMEVQPKHTIGSIIETIVDKQKLDKSLRYRLTLGNRSFGKKQYLLKVKDARISHGDHLFLDAEAVQPQPEIEERKMEVPAIPKAEEKKPELVVKAKTEEKKTEFAEHEIARLVPRFCLQCGKPLRPGRKFCLACGAPTRA